MTDQTDKAALPGHAADSPGNAAGPAPGRYTQAPDGMLAWDHPADQSRGVTMMHNQQNLTPVLAADLATVSGNDGPLASSIAQHQGRARVMRLDQVAAANPTLAGQMGPRYPGGIPGQPADHTAPTGADLATRRPGAPALNYTRTGGELQGGGAA